MDRETYELRGILYVCNPILEIGRRGETLRFTGRGCISQRPKLDPNNPNPISDHKIRIFGTCNLDYTPQPLSIIADNIEVGLGVGMDTERGFRVMGDLHVGGQFVLNGDSYREIQVNGDIRANWNNGARGTGTSSAIYISEDTHGTGTNNALFNGSLYVQAGSIRITLDGFTINGNIWTSAQAGDIHLVQERRGDITTTIAGSIGEGRIFIDIDPGLTHSATLRIMGGLRNSSASGEGARLIVRGTNSSLILENGAGGGGIKTINYAGERVVGENTDVTIRGNIIMTPRRDGNTAIGGRRVVIEGNIYMMTIGTLKTSISMALISL